MERFIGRLQEELLGFRLRKINHEISKNVKLLDKVDRKTKDEKELSCGELNFLYNLDNKSEVLNEENKRKRDKIAIKKSAISSLYKLKRVKQEDAIKFIVMVYIKNKGLDKVKNRSDLSEDSFFTREVANLGLESFLNEFLGTVGISHNKDLSGGGIEDIKKDSQERGPQDLSGGEKDDIENPVIIISEMDGMSEIFVPRKNVDIGVR